MSDLCELDIDISQLKFRYQVHFCAFVRCNFFETWPRIYSFWYGAFIQKQRNWIHQHKINEHKTILVLFYPPTLPPRIFTASSLILFSFHTSFTNQSVYQVRFVFIKKLPINVHLVALKNSWEFRKKVYCILKWLSLFILTRTIR